MYIKYQRNFVKLKGKERCPIQYLIPRNVEIKNIYEIKYGGSDFERNYKTIDLSKKPDSYHLLQKDKDFTLSDKYLELKLDHNYNVSLIIEYQK